MPLLLAEGACCCADGFCDCAGAEVAGAAADFADSFVDGEAETGVGFVVGVVAVAGAV